MNKRKEINIFLSVAAIIGVTNSTIGIYFYINGLIEQRQEFIAITLFIIGSLTLLILLLWIFKNSKTMSLNGYTYFDRRIGQDSLDFIKSNIVNNKTSIIKIDVIGIKSSTIRYSIEELIKNRLLPTIDIRVIVLSENGQGTNQRAIFESENLSRMKSIARLAKENMVEFANRLINYDNTISVSIKSIKIIPFCYMIRINDKILMGPYLVGKGRNTFSEIFIKSKYLNKYQNYLDYFEFIFNSKELSESIIKHP